MNIPYYELRVKKYKTHFWKSYCLLQSCPEYTGPTVDKIEVFQPNLVQIKVLKTQPLKSEEKDPKGPSTAPHHMVENDFEVSAVNSKEETALEPLDVKEVKTETEPVVSSKKE